ncbi:MOSC domain-containing protein [Flavobacterium sp. 83]|uniref:MOSC domain-containing protein n=1 Tax=Flavobacterium sp. 83 TaxID=1131812 RepID=UPI00055188CD|nr:MOSC N-terminal beta barrel domain-containing protein [Flavobacterium sp. 83]
MDNILFISEIYIYPIKSLGGISCQSAKAEEMGFENDRRWMLIDENNQFISQREHPILSQFQPQILEDTIEITYQGKKHTFFINESLNSPISVPVWDDQSEVFEVNKTTSDWFSECLSFTCKLVKILEVGDRKHKSTALNVTFNVSLADGYPYLLVGSESLDHLNEKLKDKITIARFRPNIVINSSIAHEEDHFGIIKIGNVTFQNVKPCGRCIMVNNDPLKSIVLKEPLKTLSKYRKVDNSVLFGTNLVCVEKGIVSVGDVLSF